MHILVATDADFVAQDVTAALSGPDVSFTICREGRDVSRVVARGNVDLAILDLQIGSKGGMAVAMDLRLDESAGAVPAVRVLMLLDRKADVHLAKRSAADDWLIKPFDPLTLKRAVRNVMAEPAESAVDEVDEVDEESSEEDAAVAG